jgi:hypothetical protein
MKNGTDQSVRESWYLMSCSFPDLNWARLRVLASGQAEVFDCDGRTTRFSSEEDARMWLFEDEFTAFDTLDAEDEVEFGIRLSDIRVPSGKTDEELKPQMLVKAGGR